MNVQENFYRSIGAVQRFQELFEHVPGVYFFVKDSDSRMMGISRTMLDRFGLEYESQIIGRRDSDFFPVHIASKFVRDDLQVLRSGQPLLGVVEVWYNERRMLDWCITNKLPVRDEQQRVIGVMGTVRSYAGSRKSLQMYTQIDKVLEHIREHIDGRVTVTTLAEIAGVSPRQLHRKFIDFFGMSVQEFLLRTRIQAAGDALVNSDEAIVEIALRFGFCDQSAFTQQFKKQMGMTPHRFRQLRSK